MFGYGFPPQVLDKFIKNKYDLAWWSYVLL